SAGCSTCGTPCGGPRTCYTASGSARRCRPAAPRNATRRRTQRDDDHHVADRDLGEGSRLAAATGSWICFEDEAGQTLRPPKARTWAPHGHTFTGTATRPRPHHPSRQRQPTQPKTEATAL